MVEIAILDGTNSSRDRRDLIRARVNQEDGYELFWIESACDFFSDSDARVREEMLRTLRKSPDFISVEDYEKRCAHYKMNYSPFPTRKARLFASTNLALLHCIILKDFYPRRLSPLSSI